MYTAVNTKLKSGHYDHLENASYIIHEDLLEKNLKSIEYISNLTGITFMFALKSYSYIPTFKLIDKYVKGCVASGLHESILAREYFNGEVETFSPAFEDRDFDIYFKIQILLFSIL